MTARNGRRVRTGNVPVDPDKFVHIDRPSNSTLRGAIAVGLVLATAAGAGGKTSCEAAVTPPG